MQDINIFQRTIQISIFIIHREIITILMFCWVIIIHISTNISITMNYTFMIYTNFWFSSTLSYSNSRVISLYIIFTNTSYLNFITLPNRKRIFICIIIFKFKSSYIIFFIYFCCYCLSNICITIYSLYFNTHFGNCARSTI